MFLQVLLIFRGCVLAGKAVGVVAVGQQQQLHAHALGQQHIDTALRRLDTCGIAVVDDHYILREAMDGADLLVGQCRAAGRHHVFHALLVHSHHVGVAFDEVTEILLDNGFLGKEQPVELALLGIDDAFGRILILHLHALGAAVQHSAAEAYHLARDGVDGEDDAVAEAVVGLAGLIADTEARLQQEVAVVASLQAGLPLRIVLVGTESELELPDEVVAETALAEIGQTDGATVQRLVHLLLEPVVGPLVDGKEALALALLRLFLVGLLAFLDLDVVLLCQVLQRLGIGQLLVLHDEMHGCAALAAGEALADIL